MVLLEGCLQIGKLQMISGLKMKKAKAEKVIVYHFNEHTAGIRYRLSWSKKHVYVRNKDFFTFVLSRYNKRKFNSLLLEGKEYFVEQPKFRKHVKS